MSPLALLFVALFNSILGLSMLFPILAPLGRQLGFSELEVGAFSTAYALMQFLMSPYWGRLSERRGRRPVLLIGILGFAVSFLAFGLAAQVGFAKLMPAGVVYGAMLAARAVGGTFSSATIPTAQAYVADVTGRRERTAGMAVIGAAFGLGVIFGPGIGAALSTISLLTPVYASAGVALLNALFVWWKLPEPRERLVAGEVPKLRYRDRRIWPLLGVGLVVTLSSVALEQTVAFYYQDRLHVTPARVAQLVGIALVLYGLVATLVQGLLVRRFEWSPLGLIRSGLPVALAGYVVFIFAHEFLPLTFGLMLQGFGQGLVLPGVTAALSLAVGEREQGSVAGLNSSVQALGRTAGPLVGTGLYELQPVYPYVLASALLSVGWLFVMLSRRVRRAAGS